MPAMELDPDQIAGGVGVVARGALHKLDVTYDEASPAFGFLVGTGQAAARDASAWITLGAGLNKRLNVPWGEGTFGGSADAQEAVGPNTAYHVFVIRNPTNGKVDVLTSKSATAPTLPAGYTQFRRIWTLVTDPAGVLRRWVKVGRWFRYFTGARSRDAVDANNGAGAGPVYRQLIGAPKGLRCQVEFYFRSRGGAGDYWSGVYDPAAGYPAFVPNAGTDWAQVRRSAQQTSISQIVRQWISTDGVVITHSTDPNDVVDLGVLGWEDLADDYL